MAHHNFPSRHTGTYHSLLLFLLALANYVLMYGANILLARTLNVGEFDDYSVALSTVTILSTLATLGLEKYALRAFSIFRERQDWRRFRGYWLFSLRTICGFSVLLTATLGIGLEAVLAFYHSDYHIAIVVFAGFLPIIALSLYLVEFIAAHGAVLLSVAIYRLLLPILYLIFLIAVSIILVRLSALIAVICFGLAWVSVCLLMWRLSEIIMPASVNSSIAITNANGWLRASLPLVMNSLMMTVMTSGGVVIMELLFPSSIEVGIYAVSAQTGSFISLIGTSTNRYYLPIMAVLTEQRNKGAIQELLKKRIRTVGSLILFLLLAIFLYGEKILGLFGAHFSIGYDALVIIGVGASISALYADIPYYLQFMGLKRTVFNWTLAATLSMLVMGFTLGPVYGSSGVAVAYMAPVVVLFIGLRIIASGHFRRM